MVQNYYIFLANIIIFTHTYCSHNYNNTRSPTGRGEITSCRKSQYTKSNLIHGCMQIQ